MQRRAKQHIFVPGTGGAGQSTLAKAWSRRLQLPLPRRDDDPDFRPMVSRVERHPAECYKVTDPPWSAQWQALRRHVVQEAVTRPPPHIIEGTHILAAPELTLGHRRILADTPWQQLIRPHLARERAKYAEAPVRSAERHAGAPGAAAARRRVLRARPIDAGLRPEIEAFRHLPGVDIVPSRAFKTWLPQQVKGRGLGSGLAS